MLGTENALPLPSPEAWAPRLEAAPAKRRVPSSLRHWRPRVLRAKSQLAGPDLQPDVLILAHAALAADLPGRIPTKERVERAIASGATSIEIDAAVTSDNVPVVDHDHLLPDGRRLRDVTFAEYNVARGGKAVKLDLMATWIGNRAASMLDLKIPYGDSEAVGVIADWLNAHRDVRASVCEKNPDALRQIGATAPHVPLWRTLPQVDERLGRPVRTQILIEVWKQHKRTGWKGFGLEVAKAVGAVPGSRLAKFRLIPFLGLEDQLAALVDEVGAVGVTVEHSLITKKLVQAAKLRGIPVIAWVVNDKRHTKRLVRIGVHGLTSDNPAAMARFVQPKLQTVIHPGLVA